MKSALYVSREKTDLEVGLDKTSGMAAIASSRDSFAFESSFSSVAPSSSRLRERPAKGSVSINSILPYKSYNDCLADSKGL